jgi:hypothetical protein
MRVKCQPGLQAEEVFAAELGPHQVKPGQVDVRFVADRNRPVAVLQKNEILKLDIKKKRLISDRLKLPSYATLNTGAA